MTDIFQRQESLLSSQNLLEEVSVDHGFRRHVELEALLEVLHKATDAVSQETGLLTRSLLGSVRSTLLV